jgi:hypothetical protein
LNALRILDCGLVGSPATTTQKFVEFLEVLDAKRKTDSNIHLLGGTPHTGVHASKIVRQWLGPAFSFSVEFATLNWPTSML